MRSLFQRVYNKQGKIWKIVSYSFISHKNIILKNIYDFKNHASYIYTLL